MEVIDKMEINCMKCEDLAIDDLSEVWGWLELRCLHNDMWDHRLIKCLNPDEIPKEMEAPEICPLRKRR